MRQSDEESPGDEAKKKVYTEIRVTGINPVGVGTNSI